MWHRRQLKGNYRKRRKYREEIKIEEKARYMTQETNKQKLPAEEKV
jgi:hypothetical protein